MDTVYTVIAYRFGDKERYSYLVGVFEDECKALEAADKESDWRGGKYGCEVLKVPVCTDWRQSSRIPYKRLKGLL